MNMKKYIITILCILGIFASIFGGVIAANALFNFQLGNTDEDSEASKALDKTQMFAFNSKVNILILGVDVGGLLTDTIMLVSADPKNKKINVLSIPRDTRVKIKSGYQRINAAHAIGNEELAVTKVKELTAMPIHYYIKVDTKGFRNIIDILGSVDFDVPMNMKYSDPAQKLYIDLKKGMQKLDGDKAEQLVRFRGYPEADIARIRTQQAFIKELVAQKLTWGTLAKADEIYKIMNKNVKTNIGLVDITKNLGILKLIKPEDMKMFKLPGYPKTIGGISYYICNDEETMTMVEDDFGYKSK